MTRQFAILSGTGLTGLDGFVLTKQQVQSTPYGHPSASLMYGMIHDCPLISLARHGKSHQIPPHKINYRANIWALKSAGVTDILSISAVGGIHTPFETGLLCCPDQIVDYTYGREHSIFDEFRGDLKHVDMTTPYSEPLRKQVIEAAGHLGCPLIDHGTLAVTQGPRLETKAEIDRLERDQCDIVNMTAMPEASLARECGLAMANIALVVNPAAGRSKQLITSADIRQIVAGSAKSLSQLIQAVLMNSTFSV